MGVHVTPAFPDIDHLEEIGGMLDALSGAAGVLAQVLEAEKIGSDAIKATYGIGHLADAARARTSDFVDQLLAYRMTLAG